MPKRVALLGSTGSIGTATLRVLEHLYPEFELMGIAAGSNVDMIEQQIRSFSPRYAVLYDQDAALDLQRRQTGATILSGMDGLCSLASLPEVDIVVAAIGGTRGIAPTVAAIEAGKDIGLANKEVLVSAGALVRRLTKSSGSQLLPIDSEHSAIFQCLQGAQGNSVRRLILTASGGPFRQAPASALESLTPEQALAHPTWSMGKKISIDSSTLMNKGLEVIEARWLFDLPVDQIDVVVHPQSIIHSMVEFEDCSILAQMGEPNMELPIQFALTYPERRPSPLAPFDFLEHPMLTFEHPDRQRFPCLQLAFDAVREGASYPCYMNAANEVLVERFLNREISWRDIGRRLSRLLERHKRCAVDSLEAVLDVDQEARQHAQCAS